jgi:hypothetical protein
MRYPFWKYCIHKIGTVDGNQQRVMEALGRVLVDLREHAAVSRSNLALSSNAFGILPLKNFITQMLIPTWAPEFPSPSLIDSRVKTQHPLICGLAQTGLVRGYNYLGGWA